MLTSIISLAWLSSIRFIMTRCVPWVTGDDFFGQMLTVVHQHGFLTSDVALTKCTKIEHVLGKAARMKLPSCPASFRDIEQLASQPRQASVDLPRWFFINSTLFFQIRAL
ncbi:hypothetical protein GALMADRAFT_846740 [Galerina marginata CBS 339.88]|uniref:Uncharacterized protein n=1 Tax=Galerina marginata (strain CBS 339.88) TaxID=685588 RepID=A0A067THW7_GALM3|nr:hypothetical protein GALMADRAFT_846740 [Galerina marginata CBS 339.88]